MNGTTNSCEREKSMKNGGFTLIEIILVVIIGAIVATMIFHFVSTSRSTVSPVVWMKKEYGLQRKMEEITARYRKAASGGNFRLDSFYLTLTKEGSEFKEYIDTDKSGFLTFQKNGPKKFQANTPQSYPATASLLITITKDGQALAAIFSGVGQL